MVSSQGNTMECDAKTYNKYPLTLSYPSPSSLSYMISFQENKWYIYNLVIYKDFPIKKVFSVYVGIQTIKLSSFHSYSIYLFGIFFSGAISSNDDEIMTH